MAEGRWRRGALPRKQQKARGVDAEATSGGALWSTAEVERDRATARRRRPVEYGRSAQRITSDGRWRRSDGGQGVAEEATAGGALTQKQRRTERCGQRRRSNATGPRRVGGDRSSTAGPCSGARAAGTMEEGRWRRGALPRKQQKARGVDTEATSGEALRSTAEVERDRATARRRRPVEYGRSAQRITSDGDDGGTTKATGNGGRSAMAGAMAAARRQAGVADEAPAGGALTRKQQRGRSDGDESTAERAAVAGRRLPGNRGGAMVVERWWWSDGGGATVAGRRAALRRWRTVGRPRSIATGDGGSPGPRRR